MLLDQALFTDIILVLKLCRPPKEEKEARVSVDRKVFMQVRGGYLDNWTTTWRTGLEDG